MERPQKSVLRAYVYLFLLGYVGGHRFYMKKASVGTVIALLFLLGAGLVIAGTLRTQSDLVYAGYAAWAIVVSVLVVDLVMIPGMIEELNNPGEDRRLAVIAGNLDPSFQATLRQAGRGEDLDAPRKSALPEDYERPWKRARRDTETYTPGDD